MKYETADKVINSMLAMLDKMSESEMNAWTMFVKANSVVSTFEELECLMNINFVNGSVSQGICVITDWTPGLIVLQSNDGELPKMYVVSPEETAKFMTEIEPLLEPKYPRIPHAQDS